MGIDDGLEHQGREGFARLGLSGDDVLRVGLMPGDFAALRRGRREIDDRVEDRLYSDVEQRRNRQDREDAPRHERLLQSSEKVLDRQGALLEELLHQALVGLGDHLDEGLALGVGGGLHVLWHLDAVEPSRLVVGVDERLAGDEVPVAHELLLFTQGDGHGEATPAERRLQRSEHAVERRAIPIHPVHRHQSGQAVFVRHPPGLGRLDLDPGDGVDNEERRVGHPQGRLRLGEEVGIARGVDEVDLDLAPLGERHGGLEADPPFDLVGIEVGDRRAVLDATETVRRSGSVEEGGDQRRLSASTVPDDRDVPDAVGVENLGGCHLLSPHFASDGMERVRPRCLGS